MLRSKSLYVLYECNRIKRKSVKPNSFGRSRGVWLNEALLYIDKMNWWYISVDDSNPYMNAGPTAYEDSSPYANTQELGQVSPDQGAYANVDFPQQEQNQVSE